MKNKEYKYIQLNADSLLVSLGYHNLVYYELHLELLHGVVCIYVQFEC